MDAGTSTDAATLTEPEWLGPCEPGTAVNLEGIVWHETDAGRISITNIVIFDLRISYGLGSSSNLFAWGNRLDLGNGDRLELGYNIGGVAWLINNQLRLCSLTKNT